MDSHRIEELFNRFATCIENWPRCISSSIEIGTTNLEQPFVNGSTRKAVDFSPSTWDGFITGFEKSYASSLEVIRRNAPQVNIFRILNLGYDELRHSRMLAWLLDCHESHMHESLFFDHFVDLLGIAMPTEFKRDYHVRRERFGRVDISIYRIDRFAIFIENKVRADEREGQLDDEYDSLQEYAEKWRVTPDNRHMVFLTPEGRSPRSLTSSSKDKYKESIDIGYSELVRELRRAAESEKCTSDYIRRLVRDYSRQVLEEIAELAHRTRTTASQSEGGYTS